MHTSTFDPTRAVVFDLNRGQVTLSGGAAVLLLPADALAEMCTALDPAAVRHFGSLLGQHAGARVRARWGVAYAPTLEAMVDQLGGELSLAGLGSLVFERWGQALVVHIEGCPLPRGQELMSAYIESALRASVERDVNALVLERDASSLRLLLCSKSASLEVTTWLAAGMSWSAALAALHRGPESGAVGDPL